MILFVLIIIHTSHITHGVPTGQYFITTPVNSIVNSGQHVRLSCKVGSIAGSCQWTRDGFALGTDRNLAGYSRYLMAGDREDVCDLSIDPVLKLDEGTYQCQVSGGRGMPPIATSPVYLSVNTEPGIPYIVQAKEDGVMEVEKLEEVELQCESQGGRPPAEIQWWDGEGRRIVSDVTEHVMRMEDRKTFKTVSTLKIKASNYQLITCSAHNDVFPAGRMSKSVQIGTEDQVEVETKELEDGDSVEIICQEQQNDRSVKFKWLINDAEIFDEDKNILELQKFSKSFDNSHIKCLIEDSMGHFNVVRAVKLVYKIKARGNVSNHPQPVLKFLLNNSISQRSQKQKDVTKKKTMLSCEMKDDNAKEPNYVYMDNSIKI